jgi:predicted enzyme involved in methoxymalonyl-ACP biosynthesis
MSCRAFSRRVEHHLLERLFQRTGGKDIEFLFQETDRNQPLREFFRSVGVRQNGSGVYRLSRAEFAARCDWLPHRISELPV